MSLILTPVRGIPLIKPGDPIHQILLDGLVFSSISLENDDILVVTQKIVSKSENRLVFLPSVNPSGKAIEIATETQKDPRLVELILRESKQVLRTRPGTIIVEHKLGFICANAGIDHSNIKGEYGNETDWVLLLPENPDYSAKLIQKEIEKITGKVVGILITDSHGRAWRLGTMGTTIGLAGVPGIIDYRGKSDLFGYILRVTQVAAADELAAAANLVMGEADEQCPAVHVRGFPFQLRESCLKELIRPVEMDLFR